MSIEEIWAEIKYRFRRKKMAKYDDAYKEVIFLEGGYVNHPDDNGGETYKGIARADKYFPNWKGWMIVDEIKIIQKEHNEDIKWLNKELNGHIILQKYIKEFYKEEFWDFFRCDDIESQFVAEEIFESGVNCGKGSAATWFQRTLNLLNRRAKDWEDLKVDGQIGPKTISVANKAVKKRETEIEVYLNIFQGYRYITLAEKYEKYEVFAPGWARRIFIRSHKHVA